MPLTQEHRSSIYRSLAPILGEEEVEAMLAEFPAAPGDRLVTQEHLRAEMAQLRTEMADVRTELADLRAEVHRLSTRTIVWLGSTVLAAAGLVVAFG